MPLDYKLELGDFIYYDCSVIGFQLCEIIRNEVDYSRWGVPRGHLVKILRLDRTMIADKAKMFLPQDKIRADKLAIFFNHYE